MEIVTNNFDTSLRQRNQNVMLWGVSLDDLARGSCFRDFAENGVENGALGGNAGKRLDFGEVEMGRNLGVMTWGFAGSFRTTGKRIPKRLGLSYPDKSWETSPQRMKNLDCLTP